MTGGKGTRLAPFTQVLPKGLLPVGGKPILETIIRQLRRHGFQNITMACGYLAPLIRTYFGNGSAWDVNLRYHVEAKPLGTSGALPLLAEFDSPVLVTNCDVLTTLDFRDLARFHRERVGPLTIASQWRKTPNHLGVLETEGERLIRFVEKPDYSALVSMGIYMCDPEVCRYIPKDIFFDIPDLVKALLQAGRPVHHFRNDSFWMDIGRPDDYYRANELYPELVDKLLAGEER